jgi:hypothetical protein
MQLAKHSSKETLFLQNPYMTHSKNQKQFYTVNNNWFYDSSSVEMGKAYVEGTLLEKNVFKLLGDKLFSSSILSTQFEPF